LDEQRELLGRLNTNFDTWYPESKLHQEGKVEAAIEQLKTKDEIYEQGGRCMV
jgi:arginyl-tRNA synthetase